MREAAGLGANCEIYAQPPRLPGAYWGRPPRARGQVWLAPRRPGARRKKAGTCPTAAATA